MRTVFVPPYAEKAAAIRKLTDHAAREVALQKLDAEVARDNYRPSLERLERRMKEFLEWAAKP
jgi:hypothetical protein